MFEFIKIPAVKIKKSKLSREELVRVFKTRENEGKAWEGVFFDALYLDDKKEIKKLSKEGDVTQDSLDLDFVDFMIAVFTERLGTEDSRFELFKKYLISEDRKGDRLVKNIEYDNEIIKFDTRKGWIKVAKLTAVYPNIHELFPNIESKERYGFCHDDSMIFAKHLNVPCKVATGYIGPLSHKSQVLHSWVEYKRDGKIWVADVSRNILMEQKSYYRLRGIRGPVYKISKETLIQEEDLIDSLIDLDLQAGKLYLSNRPLAVYWYNKLKNNKIEIQDIEAYNSEKNRIQERLSNHLQEHHLSNDDQEKN